MNERKSRRRARPYLLFLLAVLSLAVPVQAGPGSGSQDKAEAAKVAKKVEKAALTAHQAEEERQALRHFQHELEDYAELHAKQLAKVKSGAVVDGPEALAAQKALAPAIVAKRAKAKPGDIFRPETVALFRRLIAAQLDGPDALDARKAVRDGNPGQDSEEPSVPVDLRVNAEYPIGATRSTIPASLLLTLPVLPDCLQYRFVGPNLVLVDSVAQLIVDFLPAATPEIAAK
jgi:hypothetical protein